MSEQSEREAWLAHVWRTYLNTGRPPEGEDHRWYDSKLMRSVVRHVPADPRCRWCQHPFEGIGGKLLGPLTGRQPSRMNPQICNECERFAQRNKGGAEIELSMLFADVRGSTSLAESMSPTAFSQIIDHFYGATTKVLFSADALVEKLIGDEVTGLFVPGFAGPDHARVAIKAAQDILRATGHGNPDGPWVPVGAGVHTGTAFVGAVSTEGGGADITALGDAVNTAAHLAAHAGSGEVLVSEAAIMAAGLNVADLEARRLQLKTRKEPVDVRVVLPNLPRL